MHGFGSAGTDVFYDREFNTAFNSAGSFNLIYVNWLDLANDPLYPQAAINALSVGEYTAEFLNNLISASGLSHADLHLGAILTVYDVCTGMEEEDNMPKDDEVREVTLIL